MAENIHRVLQIIHISDMHLLANDNAYSAGRRLRQAISILPSSLKAMARSNAASHNRFAVKAFNKFIPKITVNDPSWKGSPTWLLDTGDLTTFGDASSLELGQVWLQKFHDGAGKPPQRLLYGNHDAWPGDFPLLAAVGLAERHRDTLRRNWYPGRLPEEPLTVDIPGRTDGAQIQLWTLNSVLHDRAYNTLALGRLQDDRFWEDPSGNYDPKNAVHALARSMEMRKEKSPNFRILASHHPVHYPGKPRTTMFMTNAEEVARELAGSAKPPHFPRAHLVLSGHTHELFPALGQLPRKASACSHAPMPPSQCQLIAGSLCQHRIPLSGYPHHCQVLRFYYDEAQPQQLIMERLIAARANRVGDYKFVKATPASYAEEIAFTFAA